MPPKLNSGASGAARPSPPPSSRSGAVILHLERPPGMQDRGAIRLERPRDLDDIGAIKRKRSQVEGTGTGAAVAFGPDTLETAMEKKETAQIIARKKLNEKRAVDACHPFRLEYNTMKRRTINLVRMVERVDRDLFELNIELRRYASYPSNHVKKQEIVQLQDIYMLQRLQKQEEIMRIGHRMAELRTIIRNIHRQYEIEPNPADEILQGHHGGAQKQKQSIKYGHKSHNNLTKKR